MSEKSNFLKYLNNGDKISNTLRRTFYTSLNTSFDHSIGEKFSGKKKKKLIVHSLDKDQLKLNIREELKNKLISSQRPYFSYMNNMNNNLPTFHSTKHSFNLNIISKMKKLSYITGLFKNFLNSLNETYHDLYNDFIKYLELFANESDIIKNSDIYQYDIFKAILEKFNKKITISNSDYSINNEFLDLFDKLLKDYTNLLAKNTNGKCTYFITNFFLFYKKVILRNYKIYSDKIIEKEKELDNSRDIINLLKEQVLNLEQNNFDYKHQIETINTIRNNLEEIIDGQANDIERYRNKINDLETKIKIKDYELHAINNKLETIKRNMNNSKINISSNDNNNDFINYQEKLDYENLLKNRLDRIRYIKFKRDINKPKKIFSSS
jgi:hypothetical protein